MTQNFSPKSVTLLKDWDSCLLLQSFLLVDVWRLARSRGFPTPIMITIVLPLKMLRMYAGRLWLLLCPSHLCTCFATLGFISHRCLVPIPLVYSSRFRRPLLGLELLSLLSSGEKD